MSRSKRRGGLGPHATGSPAAEELDGTAAETPADRVHSGALPRTTPQDKEADAGGAGYRSSKRSSRSGKKARKAEKTERVREQVGDGLGRFTSGAARAATSAGSFLLIAAILLASLYGLAMGINAFARWNAKRLAAQGPSMAERAKDNLLVIGTTNGQAIGFTAIKIERAGKRVLGIAIPDGAFVEVPGQGFERLGESYVQGPEVSKDAVSNYLYVPFNRYIVVDGEAYQALLKSQNVDQLVQRATLTDLTKGEKSDLESFFASVNQKNVWIAPLPVKPVIVGDQRYFEPQRREVADLLLQWWGVKLDEQKSAPRVIVYNGIGTPGIAGKAAQQLIRAGFRVVDSGNAPNFDFKVTQILLYHGTEVDAAAVRKAIGAGEVKIQSAPQELTDLIVIIGADYQPPAGP
ncbi:MAG: LytR C-terminal domain-containing protein [Coriobacteriia bacterium]|nr:LytR C-terminal domain-containing protein [Coriobacteriia bacterium]